jgi:hypothetical protein
LKGNLNDYIRSFLKGLPEVVKREMWSARAMDSLEKMYEALVRYETYQLISGNRIGSYVAGRPLYQCTHCGKKGHTVERCWRKMNDERFQQQNRYRGSYSSGHVVESTDDAEPVCFWTVALKNFVIDSGCTDHMVWTDEGMIDDRDEKRSIVLADGSRIYTEKSGTICMRCRDAHREIRLMNVLFVPSLSRDLKSVSRLLKAVLRVEFGTYEVRKIGGSVVYAKAFRQRGLFVLQGRIVQK